jgi:glucosamine kinase
MARLGNDPSAMVAWAAAARPREWATFARDVFHHATLNDPVAVELVRQSAADVQHLLDRLVALGGARIALMGGVAAPTRPYLDARYASVLVEPAGDAMAGALLLAGND